MSQELFTVLMAMVVGAVILATGFALGMPYGVRAERRRIDEAEKAIAAPPISPEEEEEASRKIQRELAEKFRPGISHRFIGPSFGRPRLIVFHESDYESVMMCAVGEKDTHELTSGQRVYEIPVDNHDGQEGNVLLVCYLHGRPDEMVS